MKIEMPIQDMFWGDRHGVVSDKFGNRWSISTHKEDVPRDQMDKRAAEAMASKK
jgi:PhnB protein